MNIYLNIFRKIIVADLQQKYVGRHTRTSLYSTKSDLYYNNKVFVDGECLHDTIKDAAQWIIYLTTKPNNMIHIKCVLGLCDEFSEYNIPNEELFYWLNTSFVHFSVYKFQRKCATHGIFPNGPSVCLICEENDDKTNDLIKRSEYGKEKHLTKM